MATKTLLLSLLACVLPVAQRETPTLERVLAVEEADSPLGRFRVVLALSAPIPAPRGAKREPAFLLGDAPLRFPGIPGGTVVFGYTDVLPDGLVAVRMTNSVTESGAPSAEVVIPARAMLEESRPEPGRPEPPHVRRSVGSLVDVGAAWAECEVVLVGRFQRGDVDLARPDLWHLTFGREAVLRAPEKTELPETLAFALDTPHTLFELGAAYILFCRRAAGGGIDPSRLVAVRRWWPRDDSVTSFLATRAALGDLASLDEAGAGRARSFLLDSTRSPATEVRLAAASELARLPASLFAPTEAEARQLRERAAEEPSEDVRRALLAVAGLPRPAGR